MEDFYHEVKKALKSHLTKDFKKQHNADPFITLSLSSKPILISEQAFYKSKSEDKDNNSSLEQIFNQHLKLKYEIPYAGVIDEKKRTILTVIKGQPGLLGYCEWTESLIAKASKKASEKNMKIFLGHTHLKNYGAICSRVFYIKKILQESKNPLFKHILEKGTYKKYGGDYSEMLSLTQMNPQISNLFSILSPEQNHAGFFEVKPLGEIVYHPWKISN